MGTIKNVVPYGVTNVIVTMKAPYGYLYKTLDLKTFDLRPTPAFMKTGSMSSPSSQSFPMCLDNNHVWHTASTTDAIYVMASHPAIMCKQRQADLASDCRKANDGVIPFFCLKRGNWERMPSIPEQPKKAISICVFFGSSVAGTSVACKY